MITICEYLLSKINKVKSIPSPNSTIEEVEEWIKSYNVKENPSRDVPPRGETLYVINYNNKPELNWISLLNNNGQIHNIVFAPNGRSLCTVNKINDKTIFISAEKALELMQKILENPKVKLYKTKL